MNDEDDMVTKYGKLRAIYERQIRKKKFMNDDYEEEKAFDQDPYNDPFTVRTIAESTLDSIIEAIDSGETPEWLILKGDPAKKEAADAWVAARKRIAARKKAEEKARVLEELRAAALSKLSKEERAALGI